MRREVTVCCLKIFWIAIRGVLVTTSCRFYIIIKAFHSRKDEWWSAFLKSVLVIGSCHRKKLIRLIRNRFSRILGKLVSWVPSRTFGGPIF